MIGFSRFLPPGSKGVKFILDDDFQNPNRVQELTIPNYFSLNYFAGDIG